MLLLAWKIPYDYYFLKRKVHCTSFDDVYFTTISLWDALRIGELPLRNFDGNADSLLLNLKSANVFKATYNINIIVMKTKNILKFYYDTLAKGHWMCQMQPMFIRVKYACRNFK